MVERNRGEFQGIFGPEDPVPSGSTTAADALREDAVGIDAVRDDIPAETAGEAVILSPSSFLASNLNSLPASTTKVVPSLLLA